MADFISPGIIGNPMNPYQQSYSDTCAIKSQQLILSDFGIPITEDQLVQYSMDQGWYTGDGSGTHLSDVGKLLADAGIPCTQSVDANIYDLVDELQQGHKVIVGVDSGELWDNPLLGWLKDLFLGDTPDHALIVAGIDTTDPDNPMVILTDPGTGQPAEPYPLDQFMDAWSDSQHFMVATDIPIPAAVDFFQNNNMPDFHLPEIAGVDYDTFNDYHNYSHTIDFTSQFPDLYNSFKLYPTMPGWTFDDALLHVGLPPFDPTLFPAPTFFDPLSFNYADINNFRWLTPDLNTGMEGITTHSLDVLQDSYDDCMRHAQECMDNGMPVSSQLWINQAHDAQSAIDNIISGC